MELPMQFYEMRNVRYIARTNYSQFRLPNENEKSSI